MELIPYIGPILGGRPAGAGGAVHRPAQRGLGGPRCHRAAAVRGPRRRAAGVRPHAADQSAAGDLRAAAGRRALRDHRRAGGAAAGRGHPRDGGVPGPPPGARAVGSRAGGGRVGGGPGPDAESEAAPEPCGRRTAGLRRPRSTAARAPPSWLTGAAKSTCGEQWPADTATTAPPATARSRSRAASPSASASARRCATCRFEGHRASCRDHRPQRRRQDDAAVDPRRASRGPTTGAVTARPPREVGWVPQQPAIYTKLSVRREPAAVRPAGEGRRSRRGRRADARADRPARARATTSSASSRAATASA